MSVRVLTIVVAVVSFFLGASAAFWVARQASSEHAIIVLSSQALNEGQAGILAAKSGKNQQAISHVEAAISLSEKASEGSRSRLSWSFSFPLQYGVARGLGIDGGTDKLATSRALFHGVLSDLYATVGDDQASQSHMKLAAQLLNAPEERVRELSRRYMAQAFQ